jgi:hypothetical protein
MGFDSPIVDLSQIANTARAATAQRVADQLQAPMASEDVRRVAEEFEAVFIAQMMAPMFQGLETDELFGGGPGEDIYRSVLVEEYGKSIAPAVSAFPMPSSEKFSDSRRSRSNEHIQTDRRLHPDHQPFDRLARTRGRAAAHESIDRAQSVAGRKVGAHHRL